MTPSEVMVVSLCDDPETRQKIFAEITLELMSVRRRPHDEFEACVRVLRKRGLLLY